MTDTRSENEQARRSEYKEANPAGANPPAGAPAKREPGEAFFAFLVFLLGALGWRFALDLSSDSYSAPSVFPKAASILIMAGGALSFYKALKRPAHVCGGLWRWLLPPDVLVITAMLGLYCLLLPLIHYPASSYLFLVSSMTWLYRGRHILRSCLYSALILAGLILVFRYVMLVLLP